MYVSEDYQNDWDGKGVNAGVYFYVLESWQGNGRLHGSLMVVK